MTRLTSLILIYLKKATKKNITIKTIYKKIKEKKVVN